MTTHRDLASERAGTDTAREAKITSLMREFDNGIGMVVRAASELREMGVEIAGVRPEAQTLLDHHRDTKTRDERRTALDS